MARRNKRPMNPAPVGGLPRDVGPQPATTEAQADAERDFSIVAVPIGWRHLSTRLVVVTLNDGRKAERAIVAYERA